MGSVSQSWVPCLIQWAHGRERGCKLYRPLARIEPLLDMCNIRSPVLPLNMRLGETGLSNGEILKYHGITPIFKLWRNFQQYFKDFFVLKIKKYIYLQSLVVSSERNFPVSSVSSDIQSLLIYEHERVQHQSQKNNLFVQVCLSVIAVGPPNKCKQLTFFLSLLEKILVRGVQSRQVPIPGI